jgi:cytochrome c biogenesis protein CcdA
MFKELIAETNREIVNTIKKDSDIQAILVVIGFAFLFILTISEAIFVGSYTHFIIGILSFVVFGLMNSYIGLVFMMYFIQKAKNEQPSQ